jgi:hypothetical protein
VIIPEEEVENEEGENVKRVKRMNGRQGDGE